MLAPDDFQALGTVLKKIFQSNNLLNAAGEAKRIADARHAAAWQDFQIKRGSLAVFGFDVNDPKLWDVVREAVGEIGWNDAQRRAVLEAANDAPPMLEAFEVPEESEDSFLDARDDAEQEVPPVFAGVPAVREVVLAQLTAARDAGSTAANIRAFFEKTYQRELHEKTVGMTLYRLSKDGLVKREGRTWFIVEPSGEAMNPGASTPGQSNVFE